MACHIKSLAGVRSAPARPGALALAVLGGLLVFPGAASAQADCVDQMSRIPMAGPAASSAPNYRLNMLRRAPTAALAAAAARPRVVKAQASGQAVRKAGPARKASVKRSARKSAPVARRAARPVPAVVAPPARMPTPMPVAERELATPLSYALIATTICEARGAAPAAADAATPVLAITPGGDETGFTEVGFPPGAGGGVLPPGPPGDPGVLFPPTLPPGVESPIVILPPLEPPFEPPIGPPDEKFPPVGPPGVEIPVDQPPFVQPPIGPPEGPPLTTAVPEPGTWALMIVGFGLLGARLRARRRASAG